MSEEKPQGGGGEKKSKFNLGNLVAGICGGILLMAIVSGAMGCMAGSKGGSGAVIGGSLGLFAGGVPGAALGAAIGAGTGNLLESTQGYTQSENPLTTCTLAFSSIALSVSGWWLGLMATFFDYSVLLLVVGMGNHLGSAGELGEGIRIGWSIIRDLINVVLIVSLIWAAITIILDLGEGKNKPGVLVVKILIAAVLVNFSYFFGAVIIDGSNFISKKIYEEGIYGGGTVTLIKTGESLFDFRLGKDASSAPVSERFMNITGLTSIYDWKEARVNESVANNRLFFVILGIFGALFFSMAAAVFAAAALFIVIRFIIIVLLLILSPVGILAFTNQKPFSTWGDEWWSTLQAQALFPIVFLLMIAISFKFLEEGLGGTGEATFFKLLANVGTGENLVSHFHLILTYLVTLGLMYFSIKIASDVAQQKKPENFGVAASQFLFGNAQKVQGLINALKPRKLVTQGVTRYTGEMGEAIYDVTGARNLVNKFIIPLIPGIDETKKVQMATGVDNLKAVQAGLGNWDKLSHEQQSKVKEAHEALPEEQKKQLARWVTRNSGTRDAFGKMLATAALVYTQTISGATADEKKMSEFGNAFIKGDLAKAGDVMSSMDERLRELVALEYKDRWEEKNEANNFVRMFGKDKFNAAAPSYPKEFYSPKSMENFAPHFNVQAAYTLMDRLDTPGDLKNPELLKAFQGGVQADVLNRARELYIKSKSGGASSAIS